MAIKWDDEVSAVASPAAQPQRKIKWDDEAKFTGKPPAQPKMAFLPGYARTEQKIAERPNAIDTLREEVMTPYDFKNKPFKSAMKPLFTGMKVFNVGRQALEGAASNALMGLQETPINEISQQPGRFLGKTAQNIGQGLTLDRKGELGDLTRRVNVPEPISAAIGFFGSLGVDAVANKGKLIESAKKAEQVIASKAPKIMGKNYVLDRAKKAGEGLDELQEALGKEYDNVFDKIGDKPVDGAKVQAVLEELPENILNRISKSKLLERDKTGNVIPSVKNLKVIKSEIRKGVPDKVWSGKAMGDQNTAQIEQAYGKIGGLMAEGNDDLVALNKRYGEFMNMRKELSRVLYDADGNPQANSLARLFGPGGERGKQVFFEKFAQQWPQAAQILKDVQKYNKRQAIKAFAGGAARYGLAAEGARRFIINPLLNKASGE